jgi:putative transposase
MPYDPWKHRRRSVRRQGHDYRQPGGYFVTIGTYGYQEFFTTPAITQIACVCWLAIPDHFPHASLDEWVIMPNHMHGILFLDEVHGEPADQPQPAQRDPDNPYSLMSPYRRSLSVIVRTYKAAVTTECRRAGLDEFRWHRNYHDAIISSREHLDNVRHYIRQNPIRWEADSLHPDRRKK